MTVWTTYIKSEIDEGSGAVFDNEAAAVAWAIEQIEAGEEDACGRVEIHTSTEAIDDGIIRVTSPDHPYAEVITITPMKVMS